MATGWETYFVIFVSAVVALLVPLLLWALSRFLAFKEENVRKIELPGADLKVQRSPDTVFGLKINTRFFLGANIALVLVTLGLFLVPYAGVLGDRAGQALGVRVKGLISVLSVLTFAGIGLLYAVRKGDLDWLNSYRKERDQEGK